MWIDYLEYSWIKIDHIEEKIVWNKITWHKYCSINLNVRYPVKTTKKGKQVAFAFKQIKPPGSSSTEKYVETYERIPYDPFYDPDKQILIYFECVIRFKVPSDLENDIGIITGWKWKYVTFWIRDYYINKEKFKYIWFNNKYHEMWYIIPRIRTEQFYKYVWREDLNRYGWKFDRYRLNMTIIGTKVFLMQTDDNKLILEDSIKERDHRKAVEKGIEKGLRYDDGRLYII